MSFAVRPAVRFHQRGGDWVGPGGPAGLCFAGMSFMYLLPVIKQAAATFTDTFSSLFSVFVAEQAPEKSGKK